MPTRRQLNQKQIPLDLFPDETILQLSPNQEKELGRALADLLLKIRTSNAARAGGEQ